MVTLLFGIAILVNDYSFKLAAKHCLAAQLDIGNKYLYSETESEFMITMALTEFESNDIRLVGFWRTDMPVYQGGTYSFCEFKGNKVSIASFSHGEFEIDSQNRVVFLETELAPTSVIANLFTMKCRVATEDELVVECTDIVANDIKKRPINEPYDDD